MGNYFKICRKMRNIDVGAVQKHVNLIKSCRSLQEFSNEYSKFGFDTADNEPLKVCLIFTYLPRPEI